MARIRSVHPELFLDDAFMELSMAARLLDIGIWTQCDDHGIFEWKPNYFKATILPVDGVDVPQLLAELVKHNCIKQFEEGGRPYGAVRNFCMFQRPKLPTYKHPFPEWCRSYVALDRRKEQEKANETPRAAPAIPQHSRSDGAKPPHGRGEKGSSRGKEEPKTKIESKERVPPASEVKTLSQVSSLVLKEAGTPGKGLGAIMGTPLPADWVPSDELCEEVKSIFAMTDADLQAEVLAFHSLNAQNGRFSKDWNATFRMFCKRWRAYQDKQAPPRVEFSRRPKGPISEPISSALWNPTEANWESEVKRYAATGGWSAQFGPDPESAACRCPPHLLEKHLPNPAAIAAVLA